MNYKIYIINIWKINKMINFKEKKFLREIFKFLRKNKIKKMMAKLKNN
jgi:hypothetical protein